MKKKILCTVLVLSMTLLNSAPVCASDISSISDAELAEKITSLEAELKSLYEERDRRSTSDANTESESTENELFQNLYVWNSDNYTYGACVVKNIWDFPIYLNVDFNYTNENKEVIGTSTQYTRCLGAGETTLLYSVKDVVASRVDFKPALQNSGYSESAQKYMECTVTDESNLVFTVKNTSDKKIEYAHLSVLFWKDGEPISAYDSYLGDDAIINGNDTVYEEIYFTPDYDSYDVYLDGCIE